MEVFLQHLFILRHELIKIWKNCIIQPYIIWENWNLSTIGLSNSNLDIFWLQYKVFNFFRVFDEGIDTEYGLNQKHAHQHLLRFSMNGLFELWPYFFSRCCIRVTWKADAWSIVKLDWCLSFFNNNYSWLLF